MDKHREINYVESQKKTETEACDADLNAKREHTVNWRQNPELSTLFHAGKHDNCRKSWNIIAYLQDIAETFGQSTGSSTAVTPSLRFCCINH